MSPTSIVCLPHTEERNAKIVHMREVEKIGPRRIARLLGLTANVVAGVLNRNGCTDANAPRTVHGKSPFPDAWRRAAALDQRPVRVVADDVGVKRDTIMRWRREFRRP